jgi:hypothetical protein
MSTRLKHWIFPCFILVATCFGVFVLPFFFPPPYLAGISVANVAGFNNKLASVAAAALSVTVFLSFLKWHSVKLHCQTRGSGRLPLRIVLIATAAFAAVLLLFTWIVVRSQMRYQSDWGYFIRQISMHADYGRKLYDQIEFAYGPLLFYVPIFVRTILSPFHVSLTWSYNITLVLESVIGLLLVGYVIDNLPMLRKWKIVLFLICVIAAVQVNLGLNYTYFRFVASPAFLVLAAKRRQPWSVAACFLVGQVVSLAISPEMGVAFGAASLAYSAYFCFLEGRAWLVAAAAPLVATVGFLLLMDRSYMFTLELFAQGANNFVVEPLPHILTFLFAFVWLVPLLMARFFRERRPEAPMLAALYIFSLGLLPAAFGSADPGHVFFNGLMIFFLSVVAISCYGPRQQTFWVACVAGVFIWQTYLNIRLWSFEWRPALAYGIFQCRPDGFKHAALVFVRTHSLETAKRSLSITYRDHSFDIKKLDAIVGNAPVATPLDLPLYVEEALKRSGQFTPSRYCITTNLLYAGAEDRDIQELNKSQWALIPKGTRMHWMESPADTRFALGIQLTYPAKHKPYVIGDQFNQNLADHWQPYGEVGIYDIYRHRS